MIDPKTELEKMVCYEAYAAFASSEVLEEKLKKEEMWKLFTEIEMPLVFTLFHMEQNGVRVEAEELKSYGEQLGGKIVQLEKEKLEYDLQHKSQEMANLMINFVRKNEMLTEIKSEIIKVASSLRGEGAREGKQLLLVINSKIDSNIQSDEVLKRIEDQFDLIHNNFMKRLHVRHPDLSNNERMMCAYLKMNLSTKEIAPLLNISVRGVETIRYRLRKKFGLEREDSLTDYLSNQL